MPEKTVCAIVGNGFSIGFTRALKLNNVIQLGKLIPCPLNFDSAKWTAPWDPPDFQSHRSLCQEWYRLGMNDLDEKEAWWRFCEILSLDNVAPQGVTFDLHRDHKRYRLVPTAYSHKPFPPGYELRLYLWRLFATYDAIVKQEIFKQAAVRAAAPITSQVAAQAVYTNSWRSYPQHLFFVTPRPNGTCV